MKRLVLATAALLLSGCMSQILLDGQPAGTPHVAGDAVPARVRAAPSQACPDQESRPPRPPQCGNKQ